MHELATAIAVRKLSILNQPPQLQRLKALDFASLQKIREETEENHRQCTAARF
jgi:hypothetical protein